jgi:hypothetical protein
MAEDFDTWVDGKPQIGPGGDPSLDTWVDGEPLTGPRADFLKTDFSDYTTSSPPSDWTSRWGAFSVNTIVANSDDDAAGTKKLHIDGPLDTRTLLSWDLADNILNPDILVKLETIGAIQDRHFYLHVRASGATSNESSYHIAIGDSLADGIAVRKFVNGTATTLQDADCVITSPISLFVRFKINGTSLKAKVWNTDQVEPGEWLLEATDSDITTGGWIGVGDYSGNGFYVDHIEVHDVTEPSFPNDISWSYDNAEKYFGSLRPTQLVSSAGFSAVRAIGGLFGSQYKKVTGARIYVGPTHTSQVRVAVYSGGSLTAGPEGATLLADLGQTTGTITSGWVELSCIPVVIPMNQPLWLVLKGNDGNFFIWYNNGEIGQVGNWQKGNGRWNTTSIDYDEENAFAATWPTDAGGSFNTAYYDGMQIIMVDGSVWTPIVATNSATNIVSDGARLNGNLTSLDGEASVNAWFEWGVAGSGFPNSTSVQELTATGAFYADISSLTDEVTYQFRAVINRQGSDEVQGEVFVFCNNDQYNIPVTIYNPDCELGADGWTTTTGELGIRTANPVDHTTGSGQYFYGIACAVLEVYQEIDLSPFLQGALIDSETLKLVVTYWQSSYNDYDEGQIKIRMKDANRTVISSNQNSLISSTKQIWTERSFSVNIPTNTRYIDLVMYGERVNGTALDAYFDDFSAVIVPKSSSGGYRPAVIVVC